MILERLGTFFRKIGDQSNSPMQRDATSPILEKCIGYLDAGQNFQFATFTTEKEMTSIERDLLAGGNSMVGVMDSEEAKRRSRISLHNLGVGIRFPLE